MRIPNHPLTCVTLPHVKTSSTKGPSTILASAPEGPLGECPLVIFPWSSFTNVSQDYLKEFKSGARNRPQSVFLYRFRN